MIKIPKWLKSFFMFNAGHTYSNLSRLFLRLFTGVMFLQLGLRQMLHLEEFSTQALGLANDTTIVVIVAVELLCAVCIILGLFTRLALLPSIAIMIYAETVMTNATSVSAAGQMFNFEPGYPIMFLGVFAYILLDGPGKISLDYLIAIHTINEKDDEESEVLEKA